MVVVEPSSALNVFEGVRVGHLNIFTKDFNVLAGLFNIAGNMFLNLADCFFSVSIFERFR